jgi:hypothetical protein
MVKFVSCYNLAVRTLRPERPTNLTHPVIALRELNRQNFASVRHHEALDDAAHNRKRADCHFRFP